MNSGIPKLWTAEIISRALTLLGTMYTARVIGVTMYGLVGYVAALTIYLTTFVRFGTDYIIARELSQEKPNANFHQGVFRSSSVFFRSLLALPALACVIVLSLVADTEVVRRLFVASALGIIAVVVPLDAFFQSERKFGYMAAFRIIFNALNLGIVLLWVNSSERAWVIPAASGVATIGTQAFFVLKLRNLFVLPSLRDLWKAALFLGKESLPLLGTMTLLLLIGQFGIVAVRTFCSGKDLGLYVAAFKVTDLANAFVTQIAVVLFPTLVSIWKSDDISGRNEQIVKGITLALPLMYLLLGLMLICGGELFSLLLGSQYSAARSCAVPLAAVLVFRSVSMFYANGLVAEGQQKMLMLIVLCSTSTNLLLTLLFIRFFGYTGAAWANLCAFTVEHCLLLFALRRHLAVHKLFLICVKISAIFAGILAVILGVEATLSSIQLEEHFLRFGFGLLFSIAFITVLMQRKIVDTSDFLSL